jgi:hypothetical protein
MVATANGGNWDQRDGHVAVVKLLLDKGASVNAADKALHITGPPLGRLPWRHASIKLLLAHGADGCAHPARPPAHARALAHPRQVASPNAVIAPS